MDSDTINRYQKARDYAQEPDRLHIRSLTAEFDGRHHQHGLTYAQGRWRCDCDEYVRHHVCSHSMAAGQVLAQMAPELLEERAPGSSGDYHREDPEPLSDPIANS